MGTTIVEKIFSRKCGKDIRAGEVVMAPLDGAMIRDITGPLAIRKFYEMGGKKVFDHQIPATPSKPQRTTTTCENFRPSRRSTITH